MIWLVLYLVIAFFISSTLLYACVSDPHRPAGTTSDGETLNEFEKICLAFLVPALWPLSIAMVLACGVDVYLEKKRYQKAEEVLYSIGGDMDRIKELSMKALKKIHKAPNKWKRKHNREFSKVEQEILDRAVEENIL